jgi:hypothetical protein
LISYETDAAGESIEALEANTDGILEYIDE